MSTRTAVTIVGGVIGAYFGYPQLGLMAGALIGGAVDPVQIPGPKIGEIPNQTSADGVNRPLIWGTTWVYGNVIQQGPIIKVEDDSGEGKGGEPEQGPGDRVYRTFAIRIAGPIAGVLRVWQDNKLVYDIRTGSAMAAESEQWMANKVLYLGGEDQLPDPNLVAINSDTHAYRGTSYMVFVEEDLTPRGGSISQYRWEVASEVTEATPGTSITHSITIPHTFPGPGIFRRGGDGKLGIAYNDGVGAPHSNVAGGYYTVKGYNYDFSDAGSTLIATSPSPGSMSAWNGDGISITSWDLSGGADGFAIMRNGSSFGGCYLVISGEQVASLKPNASFPDNWWSSNSPAAPEFDGRRIWFGNSSVYVGTTSRGVSGAVNNLCRWSLSSGFPSYAAATISNVCATPGDEFYTHLGNDGRMRIVADGEFRVYESSLSHVSTETLPFSTSNMHGFGVDGDVAVFVYSAAPSARAEFRNVSDWSLISSINDLIFVRATSTRVIFTDDSVFIQTQSNAGPENSTFIYRIPYASSTFDGVPAILGDIVADVHRRCGIDSSMYDVSELTDVVDGFSAAGDYTGADVITELRKVYFFDKSEHDKKLYYPKRGLPVVETITIDDMTEVPDRSQREQAVEVPKKLNLKYQHAGSGYAPVKSTFSSSSTDVLTQGETSIDTSVVMNEDQAAQTVQKMFKVARTDIGGEMTVSVPMNIGSKYVPGNCLGVALRGIVTRERIERIDFNGSSYKLTLRPDRQSAYTSTLTGIPIPPPTLPPSTIVGDTLMAILDISARIETEDDLSYLVAVTGALPPWYGARYRRSLDGGANYESVRDIRVASVMGVISNTVLEAPESFTDYTNTVNVVLYRDGQLIESITNNQFLSEGGAFALEKIGGWEIMQYRDAVEESDGSFTLSVLHRGQLNSGASEHTPGSRFVMLDRPSHIPASSTWIGQDITHQAVSLGASVDDTANEYTETFVGRSQLEWPVASLELTRNVDDVSATWAPRYRFGSANSPVASINMTGFRVTIDDGSLTDTFDLPLNTPYFTNYDASAFGPSVTVSVQALNRITGAGPATSGTV